MQAQQQQRRPGPHWASVHATYIPCSIYRSSLAMFIGPKQPPRSAWLKRYRTVATVMFPQGAEQQTGVVDIAAGHWVPYKCIITLL